MIAKNYVVSHRLQPNEPHSVLGCLLGGAVGDALGAPVEFLSWPSIRRQFGEAGIRNFVPAYGQLGAITDDTQMMLFTAEGAAACPCAWRFPRCLSSTFSHPSRPAALAADPGGAHAAGGRPGWLVVQRPTPVVTAGPRQYLPLGLTRQSQLRRAGRQ